MSRLVISKDDMIHNFYHPTSYNKFKYSQICTSSPTTCSHVLVSLCFMAASK